jgi:hypothetical protein
MASGIPGNPTPHVDERRAGLHERHKRQRVEEMRQQRCRIVRAGEVHASVGVEEHRTVSGQTICQPRLDPMRAQSGDERRSKLGLRH